MQERLPNRATHHAMVTPEPCAGCGDATAPACPHASTPTPRDLGCHAACVHSASTTPEVSAMLLTSPPQPPTPAHTQSHARHRLVGGLGLLDQAKLLCDARPAQTRRQGLGVGGGVRGWGGGEPNCCLRCRSLHPSSELADILYFGRIERRIPRETACSIAPGGNHRSDACTRC